VIDLIFKPGRAAGDPCEIVTLPETSIVTFSNRTQTGPWERDARGRIRLYRPVGESVVYAWGRRSAWLDGRRASRLRSQTRALVRHDAQGRVWRNAA
jgi:hypothetical protein